MKLHLNRIYLVLIGLSANYPVKLIGVLKLGEILAMLYILLNVIDYINTLRKFKSYRFYTYFILIWLVLGVISSFMNGASTIGLYKGAANVIVTYASTTIFMLLLQKNFKDAIYFLIPYGLGTLVYSPFSYSTDDDEAKSLLNLTGNVDYFNFFDIYIAPVFTPVIIGATLLLNKNLKLLTFLLLGYGILAVILDARSTGFIFFFAGLTLLVKLFGFKLNAQKVKFAIVMGFVFIIPTFILLARNGLLGSKSSDNIVQYIDGAKRFNPFLVIGRPDPIVGLIAWADQPLMGHGFNKQDDSYLILAKVLGFLPKDFYYRYKKIPAHSNLINAMVEGGIFSGLVWVFILYLAYKMFLLVLKMKFDTYTCYFTLAFYYLLWNVLFSATLRLDIGHFIALLILFKYFYDQTLSNYPLNVNLIEKN